MTDTDDSPKFVIQQTLHGYSDGHRLIASSCQLPAEAKSLMLILSDLSGPGGGDQFDPYLTGYPLESAGRYALSCTWPAPEMRRPGCVWTHTLLLGKELLADLNNPEAFLKLFMRPSLSSGFDSYLNELPVSEQFSASEHRAVRVDESMEWIARRLLQAVYGSNAAFTVMTVPRYAAAETPILSLWRLQWPSLRARFTFCGGARAVRTIEGRKMDVQAAVQRDVRRLDRGDEPPAVVPGDPAVDEPLSEWGGIAATAFSASECENLIRFFNRIGDALPGDPALFRPTVIAYSILNRSSDVDVISRDLVEFVSTEFNDVSAGMEFKLAFLGSNKLTGLPEHSILHALATTERHRALDAIALQLRSRSATLWSAGEEAWGLTSLLLASSATPLADAVLNGLLDALPAEKLLDTLDAGGDILGRFVCRRPQSATTAQFWSPPAERQCNAALALTTGGEAVQTLFSEIIEAALQANADPTSPDLVEVFGNCAVSIALDWMDRTPGRISEIPAGWKKALRRKSLQMLTWLLGTETVGEETAHFVLSNVDIVSVFPDNEPKLVSALNHWLPLIESFKVEDGAIIACGALKVALELPSHQGVELVAASLDVVYRAAMSSSIPDDAWRSLATALSEGRWWQDWDRCERIRNTVIERFYREQWPASSIVVVTNDDTLFDAIVEELKSSWFGRRLLQEAVDSGASGRKLESILSD